MTKYCPPEIWLMIFGYLDKRSQFASAQVCQTWMEPALEMLWRDMYSVLPLMQLLGPLVVQPDPNDPAIHATQRFEYAFKGFPNANSWIRFREKAAKVRTLVYRDQYLFPSMRSGRDTTHLPVYLGRIISSALVFGYQTPLIPLLRNLTIHCSRYQGILGAALIESAKEKLIICCHTNSLPLTYSRLLTDISLSGRLIRKLEIRNNSIQPHENLRVATTLYSLTSLMDVTIPSDHFTDNVVKVISRHQSIHRLVITEGSPGLIVPFDVPAFGSLRFLELAGLSVGIPILQKFPSSTNISWLRIDVEEASIDDAFDVIVRVCPRLENLDVEINWSPNTLPPHPYSLDGAFHSLNQCTYLKRLLVTTSGVLTLAKPVTTFVGSSWKDICELRLCQVFSNQSEFSVSWGTLRRLIASCPRLRTMEASFYWDPMEEFAMIIPSTDFQVLAVGFSIPPTVEQAVQCLLGLTTRFLSIYMRSQNDLGFADDYIERVAQWNHVQERLIAEGQNSRVQTAGGNGSRGNAG